MKQSNGVWSNKGNENVYESGGFGWSSLLLCDLTIEIKRGTIFFSETLMVLKCLDTACEFNNGNGIYS